jgi:NADH dehydrogenase [ubiquinone] 1 alpha subcomplex assembly factor 5
MPQNAPPELFNRRRYAQRRARSATRFDEYDFLHRRAMADIVDRLETVTRDFPNALFYGAGALTSMLTPACAVGDIVHGDLTAARLPKEDNILVFDEEAAPFAPQTFNLIVSLLTLHHINDLVGALAQMRTQLKPDGLMIAVLFGEETLKSLRSALYSAETAVTGGVSPRIAPFANVRDLGACLQRAGFALPVADVDCVAVTYNNPLRLFSDLRGMGETSVLRQRGKPMSRALLAEAVSALAQAGGETRFDLVYLTGWAPHDSQQKPLKPGAASSSLEAAVNPRTKI